ncbi:MAG: glycoside hydrolase family 16 protein [Kiritimatiellae bacterium]|nr:glycoside hydrolase family 16 protein [Kiritimatiellia bacterium]
MNISGKIVLFGSITLVALAASVTTSARAATLTPLPKPVDPTKWKLLWQDEFDGTKLDDSKWALCKRGKADWMNTISDDPSLIKVANGTLLLRGIQNNNLDKDPSPYLTGAITSKDKFTFQYGKVQVRARFKSAQGAWPALWMLGQDRGWPDNGEIDLMEHLNFDDIVYQTVHSSYTLNIDKTNTPKKGTTCKIERDRWNTYGCEWDADKIIFTVNGEPTLSYPRLPEKGEKQWPFNQPFYFILSMQIGGNWVNGSGPTNPAHYPASMEIDWVRVYSPHPTTPASLLRRDRET